MSNSDKPPPASTAGAAGVRPAHLDLKKDKGLTVQWADVTSTFYPIGYLRRMSPSAEMRMLREEQARNPLTVLPSNMSSGPVTAVDASLVGHYAIRIVFSDGHDTGIFSWDYLRSIDPGQAVVEPPGPA